MKFVSPRVRERKSGREYGIVEEDGQIVWPSDLRKVPYFRRGAVATFHGNRRE